MNNININTIKLKENIERLEQRKERIREILSNIEKRVKQTPDYWQSSTSNAILDEFNLLYKEFAKINDSNEKYINFLKNIVTSDYINKENSLNELIDSNI